MSSVITIQQIELLKGNPKYRYIRYKVDSAGVLRLQGAKVLKKNIETKADETVWQEIPQSDLVGTTKAQSQHKFDIVPYVGQIIDLDEL